MAWTFFRTWGRLHWDSPTGACPQLHHISPTTDIFRIIEPAWSHGPSSRATWQMQPAPAAPWYLGQSSISKYECVASGIHRNLPSKLCASFFVAEWTSCSNLFFCFTLETIAQHVCDYWAPKSLLMWQGPESSHGLFPTLWYMCLNKAFSMLATSYSTFLSCTVSSTNNVVSEGYRMVQISMDYTVIEFTRLWGKTVNVHCLAHHVGVNCFCLPFLIKIENNEHICQIKGCISCPEALVKVKSYTPREYP